MTANGTGRKPESDRDTTVGALVHVAGLFFGLFALALVYLVADDEFAKANAANALNWHVPLSLVAVVAVGIGIGVSELAGVAIAILVAIATICFALIASVKAHRGRAWEYPIVPQLI